MAAAMDNSVGFRHVLTKLPSPPSGLKVPPGHRSTKRIFGIGTEALRASLSGVALWVLTAVAASGASLYTFNGLNAGDLPGQDGWYNPYSTSISSDIQVASGSGFDSTSAAATAVVDNGGVSHFVRRPNDGSFSFESFTGSERNIALQCDVRIDRLVGQSFTFYLSGGGHFLTQMGFRYQAADSTFEFISRRGDSGVIIMGADPGVSEIAAGDWVRLRQEIDLFDNRVSVYYLNLTVGESTYTPIAGLQDLIAVDAGFDATGLDNMELRIEGEAGHNAPVTYGDNLYIAVPEPSGQAMLVMLGLLFIARRRCAAGSADSVLRVRTAKRAAIPSQSFLCRSLQQSRSRMRLARRLELVARLKRSVCWPASSGKPNAAACSAAGSSAPRSA